jgi:hypothetical protein
MAHIRADDDFSGGSELDRIADEVRQALSNAQAMISPTHARTSRLSR